MTDFKLFRHISNGVVEMLPEDSAEHPVYGYDLEPYELGNDEYEEDKVVSEIHELPVAQRTQIIAMPLDELTVADLQQILRERELPTSGSKSELVSRIEDNNEENNEDN